MHSKTRFVPLGRNFLNFPFYYIKRLAKTRFLSLSRFVYKKFTNDHTFLCSTYKNALKQQNLPLWWKKSQKFIHQFYYTIHLPKMQLNMKNISNIFQILKGANLSWAAPYLKTGIFEFKTNWICVCRADSTQDNTQDDHISRSSVVLYIRKLGLLPKSQFLILGL